MNLMWNHCDDIFTSRSLNEIISTVNLSVSVRDWQIYGRYYPFVSTNIPQERGGRLMIIINLPPCFWGMLVELLFIATLWPVGYLYCTECINGLVQDCSISIAFAMEILQSCTKPSMSLKRFGHFDSHKITAAPKVVSIHIMRSMQLMYRWYP